MNMTIDKAFWLGLYPERAVDDVAQLGDVAELDARRATCRRDGTQTCDVHELITARGQVYMPYTRGCPCGHPDC